MKNTKIKMFNRLVQFLGEGPKETRSSEWSTKGSIAGIVILILLILIISLWSTIKLVFLSAIGYIFTYLAIKYRAEGRNFLVVSVIGLVLSFIILVQFSTPIISQLEETQAQVKEVVEEDQNMFERLWFKLDEPEEPEEPSFFEKYIPIVIIFNAINLVMLALTVFTSQEAFIKSAKQFNVRVVHATTPPESSNPQ